MLRMEVTKEEYAQFRELIEKLVAEERKQDKLSPSEYFSILSTIYDESEPLHLMLEIKD